MGDCLLFSSPKAWPYRWRDVVVVVAVAVAVVVVVVVVVAAVVVVVVEVPKALMIRLFQGFYEFKGVTKSL